jgi:hypothetical protein
VNTFEEHTEILRKANHWMNGNDFMEFCLNRWRSQPNNYDSYFEEKFDRFQNNILSYLGTLEPKNYQATLEGILEWNTQYQIKEIKRQLKNNIDDLSTNTIGLCQYYLSLNNFKMANQILEGEL